MTARGKERRLTAAIQSWRLSALESRYEREASSANAVAAARDAVLQAEINKSASEADELHGVCTELARRVRSVEEDLEEARASEAAARAEVARWPLLQRWNLKLSVCSTRRRVIMGQTSEHHVSTARAR